MITVSLLEPLTFLYDKKREKEEKSKRELHCSNYFPLPHKRKSANYSVFFFLSSKTSLKQRLNKKQNQQLFDLRKFINQFTAITKWLMHTHTNSQTPESELFLKPSTTTTSTLIGMKGKGKNRKGHKGQLQQQWNPKVSGRPSRTEQSLSANMTNDGNCSSSSTKQCGSIFHSGQWEQFRLRILLPSCCSIQAAGLHSHFFQWPPHNQLKLNE